MNKHFILKYISLLALPMLLGLTSCHSGDQEFPDFGSTSVYFANQGYVLEVDLTNDNNHEFSLNAAMGGGYGNKRDIKVSFAVDPTLLDNKTFDDGTPMTLLPSDYYQLESNEMVIPSGKIQGGVKVKLTDAFFADPLATSCGRCRQRAGVKELCALCREVCQSLAGHLPASWCGCHHQC